MRERLEMVGGHFDVASSPGQGTTVTAQIPPGRLAKTVAKKS
jgi:signal transduction histidine kinase